MVAHGAERWQQESGGRGAGCMADSCTKHSHSFISKRSISRKS
jgi:hypothetical protein